MTTWSWGTHKTEVGCGILREKVHGSLRVYQVIRLTGWTVVDWRDWSGDGQGWVQQVSVLESIERNELCELTTEYLGRTSKVVNEDLTCLLVLGEIRTLVESTTTRSIHVELWWAVQFDNERAHLLRSALGSSVHVSLHKVDVLDPSEWVFDLVSSGVVVDVVGDASLFWRVKDDQIHLRLSDSTP